MSTTRTARFVQNTLSTALYQLTAMVMGFITPRLMILYYGSEINGLIVSVTEFLTYFKMLEAGLAASVNVALYEPLARRDHQAVSGIASAARLFYNAAGWMFTGLTVAFTIAYPFFVPVRDLNGLPVLTSNQTMVHNEISGWFGRNCESLNITATYNLIYNATLMVDEGVGCALCIDGLVNTGEESSLCFRPLKPRLEARLDLVWKKSQLFSGAARKFLEELRRNIHSS